ncbi:MAG: hypothetical protein KatS3mg015_2388 [Fimbriimonadales bacterium]|nr:MAG: hypothetical protein KatS3mg015_2388 [Fimbriimonadales bacterium]
MVTITIHIHLHGLDGYVEVITAEPEPPTSAHTAHGDGARHAPPEPPSETRPYRYPDGTNPPPR